MSDLSREPVLILGGRSDIGQAIGRAFAKQGHALILAARRSAELEPEAKDISIRHGVSVALVELDVLHGAEAEATINGLSPMPGIVVCVVGLLGDQGRAERDTEHATLIMRSNFEGPAFLLSLCANRLLARGKGGALIGVSSVAGDRGRAANYVYGSAKAGLTAFLSGLRARLSDTKIQVITVKPGFVRTAMTRALDLPAPLTASPQEVGECVYRAWSRHRDIVYVRPIWRLIMAVIRALPEPVFKRLRF